MADKSVGGGAKSRSVAAKYNPPDMQDRVDVRALIGARAAAGV